jgi:hypothetical protein
LTDGENELNSLGYLLLKQGKKEEALKIFQSTTISILNLLMLLQAWEKDIAKRVI